MALQHLRSSTANKRPTPAAMSDGQLAMNTNLASPGLFLKDSNGDLVKVGPVHVGTTAPNATPAAGGQAGNSVGEQWLDTSSSRYVFKIWDGTAWRTEDGEFVNSSGDTMTGALVMDNQQQVRFRETTGNGTNFIAIQAPASVAADRTLTLPDVTGTIVSTGDTGTVTSTMILDGTILNADVNASAAIAGTKISPDFGSQTIATTGVFSHALGAAATPSITFTGDLNTGIYSPGADQVAVATNGTGRLFINSSGLVGVGTASPSKLLNLAANDGNAAILLARSNSGLASLGQVGFSTVNGTVAGIDATAVTDSNNGTLRFWTTGGSPQSDVTTLNSSTPRMVITSAGLVGIGTSSPADSAGFGQALDVSGAGGVGAAVYVRASASATNYLALGQDAAGNSYIINRANNPLLFYTNNTEKVRITSAGNVGIGVTSPATTLDVNGGAQILGSVSGYPGAELRLGATTASIDSAISTQSTGSPFLFFDHRGTSNTGGFAWRAGTGASTERMRIDTSGRLLVGTSTSTSIATRESLLQLSSTDLAPNPISVLNVRADHYGPSIVLAKSRGGGSPAVQSGDALGTLIFSGHDGTDINSAGAYIIAEVDGAVSNDDIPTRLMFSTTADGASSPTERMRVSSNGAVLIGNTTQFSINSSTDTGHILGPDGVQVAFASAQTVAYFNRQSNDGTIIDFRQGGVAEGSISVSGTTVSYNGAHLSRWSQLPSGAERIEILRGTALSNIDEMCEWGNEDNEQLNRMKVSDVEGDKNVSGVFQCWDDDDDTYTDDFYCAMTGDFIIRIAEGVTVERGDLLMSAGDGTAKPQDDDIIRSKTIAKVTSTNVSCTYDDGSYCVPCVLMAC